MSKNRLCITTLADFHRCPCTRLTGSQCVIVKISQYVQCTLQKSDPRRGPRRPGAPRAGPALGGRGPLELPEGHEGRTLRWRHQRSRTHRLSLPAALSPGPLSCHTVSNRPPVPRVYRRAGDLVWLSKPSPCNAVHCLPVEHCMASTRLNHWHVWIM